MHNECLLGNRIGTFTNKKHSECTKEKIRISTINYLSTLTDGFIARYNKQACRYIDELNNKMGWNLQHAENGGEIQCAGYYLDGYDEYLNIVFEYDEPYHYINVEQNILSESDIIRQTNIINKLHCKFYRYNEKLDLFYEIRS